MITNRQLFLDHVAQTSSFPLALEIENAKGIWMHGKETKYLDLISGIGVSNIGHRHPKVVQAIKDQADKYLHLMVYGEYIQSPQVEFATLLTKSLNNKLDSVFLVNSGSEAIEGALKLAKRYTGRPELISAKSSYHGATHGALSLSDSEEFTQPFRPLLPSVKHIEFNNFEDINTITTKTAAVILETVQGEAGVVLPQNGYLKAIRKKCDESGTLLILDEVQCGAGRTGTFWAFEQYGIEPDIITTAKGIGGGMPIGAFIAKREIMQCLTHNPILGHITTFGGHPVSSAAAAATCKILLEDNLINTVEEKAQLFIKKLNHPAIKEIRNAGLLMAIQLDNFENLQELIKECINNGVVTDWFLFNTTSMRIAPPLIITEEEIEFACNIILKALDKTYN